MLFLCSICKDFIGGCNPVVTTPCGHIFHAECLSQWLDRSATCPECRSAASREDLRKLYFTTVDQTTDAGALVNQVDELKAQLQKKQKLMNESISQLGEANAKLQVINETTKRVIVFCLQSMADQFTLKTTEMQTKKMEEQRDLKHESEKRIKELLEDKAEMRSAIARLRMQLSSTSEKDEKNNKQIQKLKAEIIVMRASITELRKQLISKTKSKE